MTSQRSDEKMGWLAASTRAKLLRRIDASLGPAVASRSEPEDILHQAFVSALPHFRQRPVQDPAGFVRWMLRFALNEIRNTSRRRHGDDGSIDWEIAGPRTASVEASVLVRGSAGPPPQERVLALKDRFYLPWTTVAFLLDRPDASSTRKLLGRARHRLRATLSEAQRLAERRPSPSS